MILLSIIVNTVMMIIANRTDCSSFVVPDIVDVVGMCPRID